MTLQLLLEVVATGLIVAGVALLSVAAALIAAGVLLILIANTARVPARPAEAPAGDT